MIFARGAHSIAAASAVALSTDRVGRSALTGRTAKHRRETAEHPDLPLSGLRPGGGLSEGDCLLRDTGGRIVT